MSLYDRLGLARTATADEIRQTYRERVKACHPDYYPDDEVKAAEFRALTEAYEVLSDTEHRVVYDLWGVTSRKDLARVVYATATVNRLDLDLAIRRQTRLRSRVRSAGLQRWIHLGGATLMVVPSLVLGMWSWASPFLLLGGMVQLWLAGVYDRQLKVARTELEKSAAQEKA